jgi:heme/copper-type cytochrome/quinol oxidase subunit 3
VTRVLEAPPRTVRPARRNGHAPPPPRPTGGGDGPDRDPSPRRPLLDNAVLATIFVIAGEVMLFAGLVFSFLIVRLAAPVWPPPLEPRLPIGVTAVNTGVLLASSVAMVAALRARRRGERRLFVRGLALTAGLGGVFLTVQGYEWFRLVGFGLTVGSGIYGATFYTLIGAHAAHVMAALAWLAVTLTLAARGRFADARGGAVTACAMYWHFVVLLWPILYVAVYLL